MITTHKNRWAASVQKAPVTKPDSYLMTYDEAAEMLRVSKRTVERTVIRDGLPVVHVGRQPRIRRSDLMDWIDRNAKPVDRHGDGG